MERSGSNNRRSGQSSNRKVSGSSKRSTGSRKDRTSRPQRPQTSKRPEQIVRAEGEGEKAASNKRFSTDRPRSDRPRSDRPRSDRPRSDRPRSDRPKRQGDSKFKPRSERPNQKGDRSLANRANRPNRRKDERRPVNLDFSKDPIIPEEITGEELDKATRGDLLTLSAENAKVVSRHLSCVNLYADTEPDLAYEHAQAAVRHAGRVAVVRETAGYAAYRIGKFDAAIKELKAAYRINGDISIWPVLADCERGLGRPRKALELAGAPEAKKLQKEQAIELRIVAAGARRDLGELEAAIVTLQTNDLNTENDSWAIRLRYAYADALAAGGRIAEAKKWFQKCAALDVDETTDAAERAL